MALAKLKFRKSLPLPAEMMLVHKMGFYVAERNKDNNYIVFAKALTPKKDKEPAAKSDDPYDLSEAVQTELLRKCNKILDHYKDPELFLRSIRARVLNLSMCYSGAERAFIQNWMVDNLSDDQ